MWLLTKQQAHFRVKRLHNPAVAARALDMAPLLDQLREAGQASEDDQLAIRDQLQCRPACQLEGRFTDRKVTKANPASPGASPSALP
ncbi:MAG: hypothetical protein ACLQK4_01235 [Acidimicrobiales bacterium]|jgi:lipopolysaccharide biosynthesis regulator YciM